MTDGEFIRVIKLIEMKELRDEDYKMLDYHTKTREMYHSAPWELILEVLLALPDRIR